MVTLKRLFVLTVPLLCAFSPWAPARAECGGQQQCIGVSINPAVAPSHGTPLVSAPLAFGNQTVATTSAAKTILVAAVLGPAGTRATLNSITLGGANAADFSITGGTCTTGAPSLLHDGAVTAQLANTCTITVAFNPATLGAKAAQIDVRTTAITRTVPLTGTGTGAPPTAAAATLSVAFNTTTTLGLAPFISGAAPLSVRITAAPANGVATISGTSVTYTPNPNYVGPDVFSYESFNSTAASGAAVVTVSVLARPDPAADANVVGLVVAQAQTARRFSRAQIVNFQRRMEALHRPADRAADSGSAGLDGRRGSAPNRDRGSATHAGSLAAAGAGVESFGRALDGAAQAQPGGGLRQTGAGDNVPGTLLASLANSFLSAAATRSLNLSQLNESADGRSGGNNATGMWIGGNLHFGTREPTGDSGQLRFSTDGVSLGVDRRFSDRLALGMGVGYARDRTDVGTDGTKSRSRGSSLAVYGSFIPRANAFVDALIGYGMLSSDTDRYVAAANDFARANRDGDQLFGSLAAGVEHLRDGLLLSPYGRLDFAFTRLEQAVETGAGANALAYFDQDLRTLQAALGLRAESRHDAGFGWALPRLRVEVKHDFKDDRDATIAYVDQFTGPRYAVTPTGMNRDSVLIGIGSDFVFRSGLRLGVDYQVERTFGSDGSQAVRLWLAKDLDGRKSALPPLSSSLLASNPARVEAGYAWDDNLTRARDGADRLSDHVYSLNIVKGVVFPVTSHTRVVVNGFLGGEKLYTYTGLDRYTGGAQAEFQYRTSGDFDAATLGVFGRAALDEYTSGLRAGYRYTLGITARRSLTDRIDVFGALAGNTRRADSVVFDARDYSGRLHLDYSLGRMGTAYLTGEYRRGDTVSTGRQSVDSIAIAKASVRDDAYGSNRLVAYRYEARTVLWTLGYNWPLGSRDSIDLSWRHARSAPTDAPNYALAAGYGAGGPATGTSSYAANLYSIAYLMRF